MVYWSHHRCGSQNPSMACAGAGIGMGNKRDRYAISPEPGKACKSEKAMGCGLCLVPVVLALAVAAPVASTPASAQASAQERSGPTAPKANQGSGESKAAKHNSILPEKSATGGGGQSSSGEAAQIEQSAAPLKLSAAQRHKIKSYFTQRQPKPLDHVNFSLSIGAAVPRGVELHKLPGAIISALGGFQGDDYVLVGHQLVVVGNNSRRVVAIVPDVT